ncbi:ParB N-terminal domain-containing protein [Peptostreptococcus porci]|uniref:ParB N-terminal domain-containing protein n=1 Tax=Peptostreptococcus porci TaxID=2652282 RepID=UPI002A81077D|nr:ParB N-terminal domain-containing protein [Peptostreptococcus porci]MDY4128686.1 ParB N-terminal domain-containing protein [Peptostreptococcus porci]
MNKIEIVYKNINDLVPYINNARINDYAVDFVASSILNFGFKNPIIIDQNNEIIAGHTRLKAAKKIKLNEVPCIVANDLTEQQIKALRLADNKVAEISKWDNNILNLELEGIEDIDMSLFGFEIEEISADEFGDDFELADGDQGEIRTKSFTLHVNQLDFINESLNMVDTDNIEGFGNKNKDGNKLYGLVKEWAELRK